MNLFLSFQKNSCCCCTGRKLCLEFFLSLNWRTGDCVCHRKKMGCYVRRSHYHLFISSFSAEKGRHRDWEEKKNVNSWAVLVVVVSDLKSSQQTRPHLKLPNLCYKPLQTLECLQHLLSTFTAVSSFIALFFSCLSTHARVVVKGRAKRRGCMKTVKNKKGFLVKRERERRYGGWSIKIVFVVVVFGIGFCRSFLFMDAVGLLWGLWCKVARMLVLKRCFEGWITHTRHPFWCTLWCKDVLSRKCMTWMPLLQSCHLLESFDADVVQD